MCLFVFSVTATVNTIDYFFDVYLLTVKHNDLSGLTSATGVTDIYSTQNIHAEKDIFVRVVTIQVNRTCKNPLYQIRFLQKKLETGQALSLRIQPRKRSECHSDVLS